jgi:response regulator RpfG family c-di-GMP phosphodiesterase
LPEQRKHSVLLVDDEPDILFSLTGLLRREFELFTAESGRAALKILEERPIDVVMTDQRMPEMTGVEMLSQVRARYPDTIRIVFTGYADIKAVVDGINTGGLYRYVTKPWDPDDLIALLHDAAAHHDRLVEQRQLLLDVCDHFAARRQSGLDQSADALAQEKSLCERIERLVRRDEVPG